MILAGPACGRTLAEYGAEVIKIDNWRRPPSAKELYDVGRGKRSVGLDLSRPAGLEVFYRLVSTVDVVLTGFRKGVADRMGMGYEQLRALKSDIIYASINAFGHDGSWAGRPGYEQNAQAATGVQIRNGGRGKKPIHSPYTFNDYGTGLTLAYGVILALLERRRTGRGQMVHTSLAQTGSTFSSPFLVDYEGYVRNEVEGTDARGCHALSRLYETNDGWLVVAEADWNVLTGLTAFSQLSRCAEYSSKERRHENDSMLGEEIAGIFRKDSTEAWIGVLRGAGIAAHPNVPLRDILDDEYPRTQGLIVTEDVPGYGVVIHGGIASRMDKTPPKLGRTPMFTEDTEAVLLELGYSVEEIDTLRADGIIPPLE